MALLEKWKDFLETAGEDCDGAVYTLTVLSLPQICFPFPGEPEINVIAMVTQHDTSNEDYEADFVGKTVALICSPDQSLPEVGQTVNAIHWFDFYLEKGSNQNMRSCAGPRFCTQTVKSSEN